MVGPGSSAGLARNRPGVSWLLAMHYEQEHAQQPERFRFERRRMTRVERKREAAEARLRVLLRGTSLLYASVALAVQHTQARKQQRAEERTRLWQAGAIACGPSGGVLAVWR